MRVDLLNIILTFITKISELIMFEDKLTDEEKKVLLKEARLALISAVKGIKVENQNLSDYSPNLIENGASFVTLTKNGMLRGCIGALEPYQPLVQDVCEHAVAAALSDYRFPEVKPYELDDIKIEISRLTIPQPVIYENPEDLLRKIKPQTDGIILRDGSRRATFLPQVWEKIPDPEDFLSQLCLKMGASSNLWMRKKITVEKYQVEEFSE